MTNAFFSPMMSSDNEQNPLRRYAQSIARRNTDLVATADDYEQEAHLHLVAHKVESRALAIWLGTKRIKDLARNELVYRKRNRPMPRMTDDEGEEFDYAEFIPDADDLPEDKLIAAEEQNELQFKIKVVTALLTPGQQRVLELIQRNLRHSEIAAELGISRPAITQYVSAIRETFARFDLQPV